MTPQLPILFRHGDSLLAVGEVASITAPPPPPLRAVDLIDGRRPETTRGTVKVSLRNGLTFDEHNTTADEVLDRMREAAATAVQAFEAAQ